MNKVYEEYHVASRHGGKWVTVPIRVPDELVPALQACGDHGIACVLKSELLWRDAEQLAGLDDDACFFALIQYHYLRELVMEYAMLGKWLMTEALNDEVEIPR